MSRRTRGFASTILLLATLFPVSLASSAACASESPRAVLVVDTGETEHRLCVALPAQEVSGLDLIQLAGEQHGLSYKFGFGGEAVCMLAGVGPTGDDCFEDHPYFWGYWRGDGNGGWIWSGSGAGSTTVEDGDVEGWSWGSGSNGDSHPRPPATTFGDVCAAATEQPPASKKPRPADDEAGPSGSGGDEPRRAGRPAPGPDATITSDPPSPKTDPKRTRKDPDDSRKEKRPSLRGTSDKQVAVESPSPTALDEQAAAALEPAGSSGPPVAGLAALGAAALLVGAGFVIARRRGSKV